MPFCADRKCSNLGIKIDPTLFQTNYLIDPSIRLIMLVISFAIVSLVCLLVTNTAQAAFSVKYFAKAEHPQVVNGDFVSSTQLTAHQVADIYSRLSGHSPLLFEGTL